MVHEVSAGSLRRGCGWTTCILQVPGGGGRGKHAEGRGCKTRDEAEEDREATDLSAMAKFHCERFQ